MDFSLSEFQKEIQQLAKKILADYCTQPRLRSAEDSDYFDTELWQQLAEAGLLGLALPESVGGMAQDVETLAVVLEQLGAHVAPVPGISTLATASLPLLPFVEQPAVQEALSALSAGAGILTCALAEPGVQGDGIAQAVVEAADSHYYLSGEKIRVPAGLYATHCWTVARQGEEQGIYLFSCEDAGVNRQRQLTTSGEALASMTLNRVKATKIVAGEQVATVLSAALIYQRAASAAVATGLCEGMLALASEHCSQRKQFGRALGSFQAVAHQLADCYIDKECLRTASEQISAQLGQNSQGSVEGASLVAAYWTTEALHRVSHRCQHVHGGTGVDRDYPLYRYCLQARQIEMDLGGQSSVLAALGEGIAAQRIA